MNLSYHFISNQYIISPTTIIHYFNNIIKMYILLTLLFIIPYINTYILYIFLLIFLFLIIFNKLLYYYIKDIKYIMLILFVYTLQHIKSIQLISHKHLIGIYYHIIYSLPHYLIRLTSIIFLYLIILKFLLFTTTSENLFNTLFNGLIKLKIIKHSIINTFILITLSSYQMIDRLIYNIYMIQLFIIIHTNNYNSSCNKINFFLVLSLIYKYINNILKDVDKISYTLYIRQINIFNLLN